MEEGHQGVTTSLLSGVGALAGRLPHIAVLAAIHPMVMGRYLPLQKVISCVINTSQNL